MMKRLTLLAMALLTMLGSAQAQEEEPEYYDVTICGKQLTSDILGDIVGTINTWIQEEGTGSISVTITDAVTVVNYILNEP